MHQLNLNQTVKEIGIVFVNKTKQSNSSGKHACTQPQLSLQLSTLKLCKVENIPASNKISF